MPQAQKRDSQESGVKVEKGRISPPRNKKDLQAGCRALRPDDNYRAIILKVRTVLHTDRNPFRQERGVDNYRQERPKEGYAFPLIWQAGDQQARAITRVLRGGQRGEGVGI
jgi:hypothetical protein